MVVKRYKVIEDYNTPYPDSIFFRQGEVVEIGEEFTEDPDWENWVWCKGQNNNQAWTPRQFLEIEDDNGVFNRNYDARELSLQVGEEVIVGEVVNGFGMAEKANGERGWAPLKCLEETR